MTDYSELGRATRAIHVGQAADPTFGDVVPPIHVATTFVMDEVGVPRAGYDYSRGGNPTRAAFQTALASLEEGEEAIAFPSGLSAEDTLLRVLTRQGDSVAYGHDVYGGTFRLLTAVLPAEGREPVEVDLSELDQVEMTLKERRPRVLWVETPSNPLLEVYDIAEIARLAHEAGTLLVVDNTFASPVLQRPLTLGADAVIHSTTKYIGGHSDVMGGAVVVRSGLELPPAISGWTESGLVSDELAYLQNAVGAAASPRDAYLNSRGLKTLEVRVLRQSESALAIARYLQNHPKVRKVHYPGLPDDPGFELASRQMRAAGGVLSFEVGSADQARQVCESTRVFSLAVSLGAVESLIEYPALMTHGSKADSAHAINPNLVRLAVGLEDCTDLIDDLERALG